MHTYHHVSPNRERNLKFFFFLRPKLVQRKFARRKVFFIIFWVWDYNEADKCCILANRRSTLTLKILSATPQSKVFIFASQFPSICPYVELLPLKVDFQFLTASTFAPPAETERRSKCTAPVRTIWQKHIFALEKNKNIFHLNLE